VIRYHYRRRDRGGNTLVPISQFRSWFREAIDSEGSHAIRATPLTYPITIRRTTALQRNSGIARLGNPVIEAIRSYLTWDDRGTSFAFWRKVEDLPLESPRVFFRLDFIVEADLTEAGDEASVARMADAAFPPIIETIWIDQDLEPADEECLFELRRTYRKPYDTNLTPSLWPHAISRAAIHDWNGLCESVRNVATQLLSEKHDLESLARMKGEAFSVARAIAEEQISCRMDFIPESAHGERMELIRWIENSRRLTRAIISGIFSPRIRLDAAGVAILSPDSLEVTE
jgi:ATP-dependent helicase HepA